MIVLAAHEQASYHSLYCFWEIYLIGSNYFRGKFDGGGNFPAAVFLGGNYPWWQFPIFLWGNCPRTVFIVQNQSSCLIFCVIFEEIYFSRYTLLIDHISLRGCLYFLKYWVICALKLFFSHRMTCGINLSSLIKLFSYVIKKVKFRTKILSLLIMQNLCQSVAQMLQIQMIFNQTYVIILLFPSF